MSEIIKAFFITGIGSVTTLFLGVIAVKIIAVTLGPSGMGLYALLRQVRDTSLTIATLSGALALVQGIAVYKEQKKLDYISTIFWIYLITSTVVSIILFVFAPQIAWLTTAKLDSPLIAPIRLTSLTVFLGVYLSYFYGLLNGYTAIGRLAISQVISTAALLLVAFPLSNLFLKGYSVALVWMMMFSIAAGGGTAILFCYKEGWLPKLWDSGKPVFRMEFAYEFFSKSSILLIVGFVGTGTQFVVRSILNREFGLKELGFFDAAWTISMNYVMLILASFQTYYLPTLSRTSEVNLRKELIRRTLRFSMLLMVPLIVTLIGLKPIAIDILYSNEFASAGNIMRWMLVGDYFKVTIWVLSMPLLAFADMKTFLWNEILGDSIFLGFVFLFAFGFHWLPGFGVALLISYIFQLVYVCYHAYSRNYFIASKKMFYQWLAGFLIVLATSLQIGNRMYFQFPIAIVWIGISLLFSFMTLQKKEIWIIFAYIFKKTY